MPGGNYLLESGDDLLLESGDTYLLESGLRLAVVREKPPLRLDVDVETPDGRHVHWAENAPNPEEAPTGLQFSSTIPGGHESFDAVLARKPSLASHDLDRLSTVTAHGPGGDVAWQGRLERAPKTSGDRMSVSPGCVGWQAHLEDDKFVTVPYVDRDLSHWGPMTRTRRAAILPTNRPVDPQQVPDPVTGIPTLVFDGTDGNTIGEALYDAGPGASIVKIYYDYTDQGMNSSDTSRLYSAADPDALTEAGTDFAGSSASGYFTPSAARRYAKAYMVSEATGPANAHWRKLAVYGTSLTLHGADPGGVWASDVVAHAVSTWCPELSFTEGANGTIRPSSFVIPHLAFTEPTTVAEIVRAVTRFGLQDWAVWDDRMFYWYDRGDFGREWRARGSQTALEETGQSVERLYESVIVGYADVDGAQRTVGPPGSGADTTSSDLKDPDPENPANALGITRCAKLTMGVSTSAGAIEVGKRFLEETKTLDSSGRARIVGYCEDSHGVTHPAWRVRAGDTITFTDTADPSPRRVVRAAYSHQDRTCSVDLDAPPAALDALLARLDVVLAPLGL